MTAMQPMLSVALASTLLCVLVGCAMPAPRKIAPVTTGNAANRVDGKTIYAARCAACHDHAEGNIPPRAIIAARPYQDIVVALSTRAMRAQAASLDRDEIESVARYLTR